MPESEISTEFLEIINSFKKNGLSRDDFLECIFELSDRQWHTYSIMQVSLKEKIEDILVSILDVSSLEQIEYILGIVPRLGLTKVLEVLTSIDLRLLKSEVADEIRDAIVEFEGDVSDPYADM